jgi:hypothetical protein
MVIGASSASAQPRDAWENICAAAPEAPYPLAQSAASDDSLKSCDLVDLYYGLEHAADPATARRCADYRRAHLNPGNFVNVLDGSGVLAMIYANGAGVPRDDSLAISFACELSAEFDKQFMVPALAARRGVAPAPPFDVCENSGTTPATIVCADVDKRKADRKRRARIDAVSRSWSVQTRAAFVPLVEAERAFEQARVRGEISREGTGQRSTSCSRSWSLSP